MENLIDKIYKIESEIKNFKSENDYICEDEYIDFVDVDSFIKMYPKEIENLFDDTKFVVFEEGEIPFIHRQYSMDAVESYCEFLHEFRYPFMDVEQVDEVENELKKIK